MKKRILLLMLTIACSFAMVHGQATWTGGIDTDWNNLGNWSTMAVPDNTVDVIINGGCPNYPILTTDFYVNSASAPHCFSLTINDGGYLEIGSDDYMWIYGDINVNPGAVLTVGHYTIIGSPANFNINGGTVNLVAGGQGLFEFHDGSAGNMNAGILKIGDLIVQNGANWHATGGVVECGPNANVGLTIYDPSFFIENLEIYEYGHVYLSNTGSGVLNVNGNIALAGTADIEQLSGTTINLGGDLFMDSDASGTARYYNKGGTFNHSGTAHVERYYNGSRWHTISSPVSGADASTFIGLYLQQHDETTNLWTDIAAPATALNPMQGYAIWNQNGAGGHTATFEGTLNWGPLSTAVSANNAGWNMVGNPYACTIDWDAASGWTKTNVNNATYIEYNGVWASYVGGVGANGGNRYISSGQGFFVQASAAGTLGMDYNVQTWYSANFRKDEITDPFIRLAAIANNISDETVIRFNENASSSFDGDLDAHKLASFTDGAPNFYSMDMAINTLPETEMIPMNFNCDINGTYTISLDEYQSLDEVTLEDLKSGAMINILEMDYVFDYSIEDDEERFILHIGALGIEDPASSEVNIYSYGNDIYINLEENTSGQVDIYNLSGQLISSLPVNAANNKVSIATSGYYMVRYISANETITRKVFIQ